MENDNTFRTSNLILAATLASLNYPLKEIQPYVGKRQHFVFADDPTIAGVVEKFKGNQVLIEPNRFVYFYKIIKEELFDQVQER